MTPPPLLFSMMNRLRLKHLRLIHVLADAGNLHRAAAILNITQPAATKILQDLENILGVKVFEREQRGMIPSEIGAFIIDYARSMLSETERFSVGLSNLKSGGYGALLVGAILATATDILPNAVAELKKRRPLMTIRLLEANSDQLLPALKRNELDLVLGRFTHPRDRITFEFEMLADEDLWIFVACSHPLASGPPSTLREMGHLPWVLPPAPSQMRKLIDEAFAIAGLRMPDNLVESSSILTTLHLVQQAGMVAVLPAAIVIDFVQNARCARLPVTLNKSLDPYGIITRFGEQPSANAQEFITILRER
jgi:DNA-binding transcriptional LysR family regulator